MSHLIDFPFFLHRNDIEEISQTVYLAICTNLTSLTLEGNPICVQPNPDSEEVSLNRTSTVKPCYSVPQ